MCDNNKLWGSLENEHNPHNFYHTQFERPVTLFVNILHLIVAVVGYSDIILVRQMHKFVWLYKPIGWYPYWLTRRYNEIFSGQIKRNKNGKKAHYYKKTIIDCIEHLMFFASGGQIILIYYTLIDRKQNVNKKNLIYYNLKYNYGTFFFINF